MEFQTILVDHTENVTTITLNRPDVFNAFNEPLLTELLAAFKQIEKDADTRSVLLTGAGKAFCSGQDLKELEGKYVGSFEPVLGERLRTRYNPVILKMRTLEKPIVAAINGVAAGAGCSLALAADLRIMSESATLLEAFIHVGVVPDSGGTYILPRLVGLGKAFELCALGEKIRAEEALRLGLVNQVVPADTVLDRGREWAVRLAQAPTKAIGLIKRLLNQSYENSLEQQLEAEAFAQETAGKTKDHFEGVRAFIEKRKPKFEGI